MSPLEAHRHLVLTPPPTPNGGLHVGHIGGPYLRADLLVRLNRWLGHSNLMHVSHIDTYQSYVAKKATELGCTTQDVLERNTRQLRSDWAALGVSPDVIGDNTDPDYVSFLRRAVDHAAPILGVSDGEVGWCDRCEHTLVESHAKGTCPRCLHDAYLNVCENCSVPQLHVSIDPRCTGCGGSADRTRSVRVFELDADAIAAVVEAMGGRHEDSRRADALFRALGPHRMLWSYPADYGFDLGNGQMLNPWVEIFFHHTYCVLLASGVEPTAEWDPQMRALSGEQTEVSYFFGVDNTYYYAFLFTHLALVLGVPTMIPRQVKINSFMTLEYAKVSTSRGNVVWARDFADEQTAQGTLRSRLAHSCPEFAAREFVHGGEGGQLTPPASANGSPRTTPDVLALRQRLTELADIEVFSVEDVLNVLGKGTERADRLRASGSTAKAAELSTFVAQTETHLGLR